MRQFITLSDIHDEVLEVTPEDIDAGNEFITLMAARRGVSEAEIKPTFIVKRLGVCYACYTRCVMAGGTDPTITMDNGDRKGIHEEKREIYGHEVKRIMAEISAADFTGAIGGPHTGATSIPLVRG